MVKATDTPIDINRRTTRSQTARTEGNYGYIGNGSSAISSAAHRMMMIIIFIPVYLHSPALPNHQSDHHHYRHIHNDHRSCDH